jgi:hypothetical protein
VAYSDDLLQTNPVVKSMLQDYARALGGNTKLAEQLTAQAVKSGADIPTPRLVGPDDSFVKLVPIGQEPGRSSFYVSKSQYDAFIGTGMDAAQVADALGLPAQSFANGGARGFQAYTMETKPGQLATVYESKVAPIEQGLYGANGGATQLVVPELSKFNTPQPIPGGTIGPVPTAKPIASTPGILVPGAVVPNGQSKSGKP